MDRATVDHLLTTTRTVRSRLDLGKPVEPEVIQECLELAIQAPNGGNQNRYHFVVVTDPAKGAAIGAIYKKVFYQEHAPHRVVDARDDVHGQLTHAVYGQPRVPGQLSLVVDEAHPADGVQSRAATDPQR